METKSWLAIWFKVSLKCLHTVLIKKGLCGTHAVRPTKMKKALTRFIALLKITNTLLGKSKKLTLVFGSRSVMPHRTSATDTASIIDVLTHFISNSATKQHEMLFRKSK